GRANLILDKAAYEHYESYLEANGDVEMDDAIFDPFLSWVNGGGEQDLFEQLPEKIADEVLSLTNSYANETADIRQDVNRISADFKNTIDKMTSHGNDIDKTRSMMGVGKGAVGSIKGEKALFKIWELISSACGEMSSDQFFGFEPFDMQGYEKWPTYLGIVGCCAVLDIIGFQAEKKCRKIEKIPNVRSDSGHLGMGAFCSAILSRDKRLINRAKAIYHYKGIRTEALYLDMTANNQMQPTADAAAD
ncbi:MAG: hypothetical protein ACNY01_09355, partial [Desulfobacteria bacterium]